MQQPHCSETKKVHMSSSVFKPPPSLMIGPLPGDFPWDQLLPQTSSQSQQHRKSCCIKQLLKILK